MSIRVKLTESNIERLRDLSNAENTSINKLSNQIIEAFFAHGGRIQESVTITFKNPPKTKQVREYFAGK